MENQDEYLAHRHAKREDVSKDTPGFAGKIEIQNSKNSPLVVDEHRERTELTETTVSAWKFTTSGWQFQVTAVGNDAQKHSGHGYVVVSLVGLAELYRTIGDTLRKHHVLV